MTIDMKGKPCPIPVVEAKKTLRGLTGGQALTVLVDNDIAVQNLRKMSDGMGYSASFEQIGEAEYSVTILVAAVSKKEAGEGCVVAIGRNRMGAGSEELGAMLIKSYIYALREMTPPPSHILFFNGGAMLSCEGANTLNDLLALQEKGVDIQTCGACLNYYGLKDKLRVGGITNMDFIATTMAAAARLVNL